MRILTLNVASIKSFGRMDQVRFLLSKYKISVAVLTETEVSHDIAKTCNIEGYKLFCPPSSTTGPKGKECGVIIFVSNEFAISTIPRPDINDKADTIPTVWVQIKNKNQDFIIGGVYRRNRDSTDLMKSEFDQLHQQILSAAKIGKSVLVLGDFNVDHNNPLHSLNKEALDLLDVVEAANMQHMSNQKPTWKSYGLHKVCKCVAKICDCQRLQRSSCIDNAYISLGLDACLDVLDEAVTDHFPLMIQVKIEQTTNDKLKSIWIRDTSKIKAVDLEAALGLEDWSKIYDIDDPNHILDIILSNINSSLDKIAPLKMIKFRPDKQRLSLRKDTLSAMNERDWARKSGQKDLYKQLRNKVTKLVKRDQIQGVLSRLKRNPGSKSAWQEAKSYLGSSRSFSLPECTNNSDPSLTAENQNDYFIKKVESLVSSIPEQKISENPTNGSGETPFHTAAAEETSPRAKQALKPWPSDNNNKQSEVQTPESMDSKKFEFKFISASVASRIISSLKNTKALGTDKIATEVLKKGVITLAGPIAHLCNVSMASGVVPNLFKKAIIHPVYKKKGSHRDPSNYRPVAILCSMSKILEVAVRESLLSWFDQTNFIPKSQFGFLKGKSVAMALAVAQTDWLHAKSHKELVGIMAFDLSSAFDTLEPSKLLAKLETAGISGVPLKWFGSYISDRTQSVLWNNNLSKPRSLYRGVPQGSILGPILFLAMIHDMPNYLIKDTIHISSRVTGYADDTTVYIKSKNLEHLKDAMQNLADSMVNYCNTNGLILNGLKTQILTSARSNIEIKVDMAVVSSAQTISILGLEYDTNFSTTPYLQKLAREANTRAALIRRLSYGMPNILLKPLTNGILMGKILSAAPAAIPIKLNTHDKPFMSGILKDIDKAIKSCARTITRTKLSDKVRSEVVLQKSGLCSLTEAVSKNMACTIWKARNEMNPLGSIFRNTVSAKNTRSATSGNLCQPVPGHPEAVANKLAQTWNLMNLSNSKTLGNARASADKWCKQNSNLLLCY